MGTALLRFIGFVLAISLVGCSCNSPPLDEPPKVTDMIATLKALQAEKSKNGSPSEIRYYVAIAPTQLNTTVAYASGDDDSGHRTYEIVYGQETIDQATVASVTEVVTNRDKSVASQATLYMWDQGHWTSELDLSERRYPGTKKEAERLAAKWNSFWTNIGPEPAEFQSTRPADTSAK